MIGSQPLLKKTIMRIRGLFLAVCAICAHLNGSAQEHFYVWQKDGSVTQFDVADVDSITFSMSDDNR